MKILHISDLHIGLKLLNHDLAEDQKYILGEIIRIASEQKPDAVVIAGDIYDKAIPSGEAVTIMGHFIEKLAEEVPDAVIMAISGNHDSAPRIDSFREILAKQKVHMIGIPPTEPDEHICKVTLTDEFGKVNFYLLPFVKPSVVRRITSAAKLATDGGSGSAGSDKSSVSDDAGDADAAGNQAAPDDSARAADSDAFSADSDIYSPLSYDEAIHSLIERENIDQSDRNVLVSHQFYLPSGTKADDVERMSSEYVTVGNIDSVSADVLEVFDYAALGHIHKPMSVGSPNFRYCGTPMPYSVDEAGQKKGVIIAELGAKGEVDTRVIPLKPLHEVKIITGTLKDVLAQGCDDYVTVVLTDKVDLDVIDMQDRLRHAFPNLLEIRRETYRRPDYQAKANVKTALNPYELCLEFLKESTDEEKELLKDIINTVRGDG